MAAIVLRGPASPGATPKRHLRLVGADEPVPEIRAARAATFRRRRLVAAALVVGVLLAARVLLAGFGGGPLTASEPPASSMAPIAQTTYVVQPGDTLWSIARSLQPAGDVRPLVDRLATQLGGRPLEVGERLWL